MDLLMDVSSPTIAAATANSSKTLPSVVKEKKRSRSSSTSHKRKRNDSVNTTNNDDGDDSNLTDAHDPAAADASLPTKKIKTQKKEKKDCPSSSSAPHLPNADASSYAVSATSPGIGEPTLDLSPIPSSRTLNSATTEMDIVPSTKEEPAPAAPPKPRFTSFDASALCLEKPGAKKKASGGGGGQGANSNSSSSPSSFPLLSEEEDGQKIDMDANNNDIRLSSSFSSEPDATVVVVPEVVPSSNFGTVIRIRKLDNSIPPHHNHQERQQQQQQHTTTMLDLDDNFFCIGVTADKETLLERFSSSTEKPFEFLNVRGMPERFPQLTQEEEGGNSGNSSSNGDWVEIIKNIPLTVDYLIWPTFLSQIYTGISAQASILEKIGGLSGLLQMMEKKKVAVAAAAEAAPAAATGDTDTDTATAGYDDADNHHSSSSSSVFERCKPFVKKIATSFPAILVMDVPDENIFPNDQYTWMFNTMSIPAKIQKEQCDELDRYQSGSSSSSNNSDTLEESDNNFLISRAFPNGQMGLLAVLFHLEDLIEFGIQKTGVLIIVSLSVDDAVKVVMEIIAKELGDNSRDSSDSATTTTIASLLVDITDEFSKVLKVISRHNHLKQKEKKMAASSNSSAYKDPFCPSDMIFVPDDDEFGERKELSFYVSLPMYRETLLARRRKAADQEVKK